MNLTWEPITLKLRTTFRIAHRADDERYSVIAHLDEGVGEGSAVAYHGETQTGIMAYLENAAGQLGDDPLMIEDILEKLPQGSRAGRAAVDIALHDVWGKRLGQPLYRLLGLNPGRLPETSFTIAIDEPQVMAQRAVESGFPFIKVKLGGEQDEAAAQAIRAACPARLRGDANAGWSREQALHLIPRLVELGFELIEQPLATGDLEGMGWLRSELHTQGVQVPLFADESVKSAADVTRHAPYVDGVVIKLMKTGGIREALRAIHTARAHGLLVMLSCMVESSVGVTAAAHLAPLVDYTDLDGPLLIRNDPYQGVGYDGARLVLPETPGIGVSPAGERE